MSKRFDSFYTPVTEKDEHKKSKLYKKPESILEPTSCYLCHRDQCLFIAKIYLLEYGGSLVTKSPK